MQISENTWTNYVERLANINKTAGRKMAEYIEQHGTQDADELTAYAAALVQRYGEGSAELACQMYDAIAEASGVSVPPAEPAAVADLDEVAKMVDSTLQSLPLLEGGVGRLVKQAGADTTLKNALRDGAEFAWVPHGDTCPFCITLASRGWQRASKKAIKNGHAQHIHAHCNCEYAIRFDSETTIAGYDPDAYLDQYDEYDGDINAMRRARYAKDKDKINAQKRAAYAARRDARRATATAGQTYHGRTFQVYPPSPEQVPTAQWDWVTDTQAANLKQAHRSLLELLQNDTDPQREAGGFLDSQMRLLAPRKGKSGMVTLRNPPADAVGIVHTHPTGETFSIQDISNFTTNPQFGIMAVVGNNGAVYILEKLPDFEFSGVYHLLKDKVKLVSDFKSDAERYITFMEDFLHEIERCGIRYRHFGAG